VGKDIRLSLKCFIMEEIMNTAVHAIILTRYVQVGKVVSHIYDGKC